MKVSKILSLLSLAISSAMYLFGSTDQAIYGMLSAIYFEITLLTER